MSSVTASFSAGPNFQRRSWFVHRTKPSSGCGVQFQDPAPTAHFGRTRYSESRVPRPIVAERYRMRPATRTSQGVGRQDSARTTGCGAVELSHGFDQRRTLDRPLSCFAPQKPDLFRSAQLRCSDAPAARAGSQQSQRTGFSGHRRSGRGAKVIIILDHPNL
jgi:hypothetical protein